MSKFITLSFTIMMSLFVLSGCKNENKATARAQCLIDSYSQTGINFQNNFLHDGKDKDTPYRNWMLLCMQSKGYDFYDPNEKAECWNGMVSNVSEESCFR